MKGGIHEKNSVIVFPKAGEAVLEETEIPGLGEDQILIRTRVSMISTGTELTAFCGEFPADSTWAKFFHCPYYPGYNNIGDVVAVGSERNRHMLGQRVATNGNHAAYVIQTLQPDANDAHVSANSGGALYDLLIHDVDFARSTLGEPVKMELSSELRSCRGGDLIDSVWRYEDGAVVHLTGGHLRGTHYPFHCGYTAVFEHGTFYYSSEQPGLFAANGERIDFSSEPDGYRKELMYFNECVKTSQPPVLSSAADALRAVTLCRRMLHGGVPGTFRAGAAPLLR